MPDLRRLLKKHPRLWVFLKPLLTAGRILVKGLDAESCLSCFPELRRIRQEDVQAQLARLNEEASVRFVQIGSNDGKTGDPLYAWISASDHWTGVLVEPLDALIERLKCNYAMRHSGLTVEPVLISHTPGTKTLYTIDTSALERLPKLPAWYDHLASFDPGHLVRNLGESIRPFIRPVEREAITLDDLFSRNQVDQLDLLHIDTEGHDYHIARKLDLTRFQPKILIIEYCHLAYWPTYRLVRKFQETYDLSICGPDLLGVRKDWNDSGIT